eukprot:TRINITY_DN247203_c0_g1_i1.p1 TRINITY_DN247203_c0_g1~~TRINITY_DN247203_c0_g1_i1.p1  ORF type:complete len:761 (-),score=215.78 TRINITY_DN247203_c0_g1_i1:47-2329(-)
MFASADEEVRFHDLFVNHLKHEIDSENMLRGYCVATEEFYRGTRHKGLDNWTVTQNEHFTWQLVHALHNLRSIEPQNPPSIILKPAMEHIVSESVFIQNPEARRLLCIVDWFETVERSINAGYLESIIEQPTKETTIENTIRLCMFREEKKLDLLPFGVSEQEPKTVRDLDPDAPTREDKSYLPDDEEDEKTLLKCVWALIKANLFEEAQELCRKNRQFWRAGSLAGGSCHETAQVEIEENSQEPIMSILDVSKLGSSIQSEKPKKKVWQITGNPQRELWRKVCWELAEKQEDKPYSQYERAIYATLSGNLESLVKSPLCRSWKLQCWAYCRCALDKIMDTEMLRHKNNILNETKNVAGLSSNAELENVKNLIPSHLSLPTIIDKLRTSSYEEVRGEAATPFVLIQQCLIVGDIDTLIGDIIPGLLETTKGEERRSICRFGAHLILYLISEDILDANLQLQASSIIRNYVEFLVEKNRLDVLFLYASQLPDEVRFEMLPTFLSNKVTDLESRNICYKAMQEHFPHEVQMILNQIVSLGCYGPDIDTSNLKGSETGITDVDRLRVLSIEWLCLAPECREDAVKHANKLLREFILHPGGSKLEAAMALVLGSISEDTDPILPSDTIPMLLEIETTDEAGLQELRAWTCYLTGERNYSQWRRRKDMIALPKRPVLVTSIVDEEIAQIKHSADMQEYNEAVFAAKQHLLPLVESTVQSLEEVLKFPGGGWLIESRDRFSEISEQFDDIRKLCLPQLVLKLHQVW